MEGKAKGPTEDAWSALRHEVVGAFTPGTPINESELFAGRSPQIRQLQEAVLEKGRHAIVYGERGVGKTSIANIFHRSLNSDLRRVHAIRVNCDQSDDFSGLWRKIFRRIKRVSDGQEWWADEAHKGNISPDDIQIELSNFNANELPIIIIDEFDRVEDEAAKTLMTDTIKSLSDYSVNCTVVIVGVAESVSELIKNHQSISRPLVQVPMRRMSQEELSDIVTARLRKMALRIEIGSDALWRLTFFSAGLPFYAHSLGKHAALRAIEDRRLRITEADVISAVGDCLGDVDYSVRESYVKATERIYRKPNIFPQVLAACALAEPDSLGKFGAVNLEAPLTSIMYAPYKTQSFAFHLNELCKPERGRVLKKTGDRRTYRFHFIDSVMQPYVIMKSLNESIITDDVIRQFSVRRQRSLSI